MALTLQSLQTAKGPALASIKGGKIRTRKASDQLSYKKGTSCINFGKAPYREARVTMGTGSRLVVPPLSEGLLRVGLLCNPTLKRHLFTTNGCE